MSRMMILRMLVAESLDTPDIVSGKAVVDDLVDSATDEELQDIMDNYSAGYDLSSGRVDMRTTRDELKALLHRQLEQVKDSLENWSSVTMYTFPGPTSGQLYVHMTGGVTGGDDPTDAYTMWEIVVDNDVYLPAAWQQQIRDACGFIDPERVSMVVDGIRGR